MGRQELGFNRSSCMYSAHDASYVCDYCVPSACLRTLLKLMDIVGPGPHASADASGAVATGRPGGSRPQSAAQQQPLLPRTTSSNSLLQHGNVVNSGILSSGVHAVPPAAAVPYRFVTAGGLYALFLMLHHELCGVHHSRMASSLVSLLNIVLAAPGLSLQVRDLCFKGPTRSDKVTTI